MFSIVVQNKRRHSDVFSLDSLRRLSNSHHGDSAAKMFSSTKCHEKRLHILSCTFYPL